MIDRDYQHSRPLDVHRWSDSPEANRFVDKIYNSHFWQINENRKTKKKHLKVILLDLYVAWLNDPELNISVHMSPSAYSDGTLFTKGKSRYNELNIKVNTIDIVHRLASAGLIGMKDGWQDSIGLGSLTRTWPSPKLVGLFQDATLDFFDVGYAENRETIILRDKNKNDLEYENKPHIKQMRLLVEHYNKLLEKTFIDIPLLERPRIELAENKKHKRKNKPLFVNITHHDKFVRRIFNNGSFSDGGRFYGGWWQHVDSSHRKKIRMDDVPTVEVDFSSLHAILSYAEVGVDYWQTTQRDPYALIPVKGIKSVEHARTVTKLFFLLSLNAKDEASLYKAFRSELYYHQYPYSFTDDVLAELLSAIRIFHQDIGTLICSGAGLRLMNIDSRICEYVIADFVKTDTPILTVHDSFIVPFDEEDRLHALMKEAFNVVTNQTRIKVKFNENLTKSQLYMHGAQDRGWFLDMFLSITKGDKSHGYAERMKRHRKYFGRGVDS